MTSWPAGEAMLTRGDLLRADAFCARMGWTRATLVRALAAGRVFEVPVLGEPAIPGFFSDSSLDRRQLVAVVRILGNLPNGAKLLFLTTPKASLVTRTPLEALRDREFARVKASAQAFAEQ